MRVINRNLKKVSFYRLTSTRLGVLTSHTRTDATDDIIHRASTPPPCDCWLNSTPCIHQTKEHAHV